MKSEIRNPKSRIVIVGAGPAGASLAIRLVRKNFDVCLIEREKFPRQKLCGEFISPECLRHFQDLDVFEEILAAGGEQVTKTVFYELGGKSVSVPSKWFGGNLPNALGLSRAEMDFQLLEKAKKVGVEVLEERQVTGLLIENGAVFGVKIRTKDKELKEIFGDFVIDATGRTNVLAKLAGKEISRRDAQARSEGDSKFEIQNLKIRNRQSAIGNRLVGFKTHLRNTKLEKGACEIYFFRGGYGGLSRVENGLANHCFLIRADVVKEFAGDAQKIVEQIVFQNKRAFQTMKDAAPVFDWLAVSVDGFGAKNLCSAKNLFAVGDAAAFIDPFTGSGMLMALESSEILAEILAKKNLSFEEMAKNYQLLHHEKFQKRLRVCAIMRRAAFAPRFAKFAVSALSLSEKARRILARSTRQTIPVNDND